MSDKKTEKQALFEQAIELGYAGSYESKTAEQLQEFIDSAGTPAETPAETEPAAASETPPADPASEIEPNADPGDDPPDDETDPPEADDETDAEADKPDEPKPKPPMRPQPDIVAGGLSLKLPLDNNAPVIFVGRDLRKFSRRMSPEVLRTFHKLFAGLTNVGVKLADGRKITDPGEVMLYLLEQITEQNKK